MRLDFLKMNGAANDFIMVDGRGEWVPLTAGRIRFMCDRRRGVGADGLIVIRQPAAEGADFHMEYYNADGFPAEMCGNGSRCAARFGVLLGMGRRENGAVRVHLTTESGPIHALVGENTVRAQMMDARGMRRDIPIQVAQMQKTVHFMIAGTRHAVMVVDEAEELTPSEIVDWGKVIRNDPAFAPAGANVNFASVDDEGKVHLRTYEKGVEAETHACGTGSVAAAVLLTHMGRASSPVAVVQHSGDELLVSFQRTPDGASAVTLEGPVAVNFAGSLDL